MTDEVRSAIARYGISKTARRLDLSFEALKARFGTTEGISKHEISRKFYGDEWPEQDREAINLARSKYDRGTHEMCQGRVGETEPDLIECLTKQDLPSTRQPEVSPSGRRTPQRPQLYKD